MKIGCYRRGSTYYFAHIKNDESMAEYQTEDYCVIGQGSFSVVAVDKDGRETIEEPEKGTWYEMNRIRMVDWKLKEKFFKVNNLTKQTHWKLYDDDGKIESVEGERDKA